MSQLEHAEKFRKCQNIIEVYLEYGQKFLIKLFAKIVNSSKPLTIFAKSSIADA